MVSLLSVRIGSVFTPTRHRVDYHSFGSFFDFHAGLFDSCDKCVDASAKRW
jgi:hypothetical protein